jgi:hypothetical protein
MKRTTNLLSILALFFLISGCITMETTRLGPTDFPPVPTSEIWVFFSEDEIEYSFTRIALFHLEGDATWTQESKMIEKAKKKAGEMGANAIVLRDMHEPSDGAKIASEFLGTTAERRGSIVAVRIHDDE